MRYKVETKLEYNNTTEYRQCCRDLFGMKPHIYKQKINHIETHNKEKLDNESQDELAYDDLAVTEMIDYIYNETIDLPIFNKLYILAASVMLSEDPEIGIAVLFSYDYMKIFHECLIEFFLFNKLDDNFKPYRELIITLSS